MAYRKKQILSRIDVTHEIGLEIGALCRPLVTSKEGHIEYVDHLSTADLRDKYATDPTVNVDDIVPVSYVWGEKTLLEAVGERRFDYVIASHVIEHIPNVIGWLYEIRSVLKPGGKLSLAIPDKRFTFDCRRELSTFAALVDAHMENRRRPSFTQILDYFSEVADVPSSVSAKELWSGNVDAKSVPLRHPEIIRDFGQEWFKNHYDAIHNGMYLDVHCSTFTPDSFLKLLGNLSDCGLLPYRICSYVPTATNDMEFFVGLESLSGELTKDQQKSAFQSSLNSVETH